MEGVALCDARKRHNMMGLAMHVYWGGDIFLLHCVQVRGIATWVLLQLVLL